MGNEQSRQKIYTPPLRENLENDGLTLENGKIKIKDDKLTNDTTYYNDKFNYQWSSEEPGARSDIDSKGDKTGGAGYKKGPTAGDTECAYDGFLYGIHQPGGDDKDAFPKCHFNNTYYSQTEKEVPDGSTHESVIENKEACCEGDKSIKDSNGKIKIDQCAFITETDNKNGQKCYNYSHQICHPLTGSEIWAPWSKTCAHETKTILDYCAQTTIIENDIDDDKYYTIYMLVPLTEKEGEDNCEKWKKDDSIPSDRNYDKLIKDFCETNSTEYADLSDSNNPNNLNGFSYPCSCENFEKTARYRKVKEAVKKYCDANPSPDCANSLDKPQCWVDTCNKPDDPYILKTSVLKESQNNCADINCNVFLNISDIDGDVDVGWINQAACNQYKDPNPLDITDIIVKVATVVGVLVFLTIILFIFKFLRKK